LDEGRRQAVPDEDCDERGRRLGEGARGRDERRVAAVFAREVEDALNVRAFGGGGFGSVGDGLDQLAQRLARAAPPCRALLASALAGRSGDREGRQVGELLPET
jgi:hypothetical protein